MRLQTILAAACLSLSLGLCAQQTVKATGSAAILHGDSAQARDRAVESALRAAVEQVLGTMVDSESLVKNNELLSDKIYTQTTGYISSYKILSEKADTDSNIYLVEIEAEVKEGNLEQDLGALGVLMRRMKMPRVAVAIMENGDDAGTQLIRILRDRGFNVVDTGTGTTGDDFYSMQEGAQSDLLRKFGAEVVILGSAKESMASNQALSSSGMISFQASLAVKALRTDTKQVLGTASGSGKAVHLGQEGAAQAARQAATVAGNEIVRQITAAWSKEASSARQVVLIVHGVSAEEASKMAQKLEKEGRGIQAAVVRRAEPGEAELELTLKGDAGDLAQEIRKLWPNSRVESQSANRLTVSR